ncbi:hypothetical protein CDAR_450121 [Caerostris darwini]|uniref:PiggyBac transposable element-derived protein domain-containing protein n=1 Tax=Caerostris darwini TaxID=1538125 RepID=A0AAV4QV05_9ARAC|nr:hypothetical protein CDAR_450121 [Caerostris darwini]
MTVKKILTENSHSTDSETSSDDKDFFDSETTTAFYNRTKGGLNAIDEKCCVHSCSRKTMHWPMALFYQLVDMSTINVYILFQGYFQNPVMTSMVFLKGLTRYLLLPLLHARVKNPRIN